MATIISRDDLAGSIEVGAEGADQSVDEILDLAAAIRDIDTENLQVSQTSGMIVIARVEEPAS